MGLLVVIIRVSYFHDVTFSCYYPSQFIFMT